MPQTLKAQIRLDKGWLPLKIMIKFIYLSNFNVIAEALSKSKAGLMEINEAKTKIRKSPSKSYPEITGESKK